MRIDVSASSSSADRHGPEKQTIAEECGVKVVHTLDANRVAHRSAGLEPPVHASGSGIERINLPRGTADEEPPAHHRRMGLHALLTRKSKRPFDLQARRIGGGQACTGGVLKSIVRGILSPAVPTHLREIGSRAGFA